MSTLLPTPGQTVEVTFRHDPDHVRLARFVRSYLDGSVELLILTDSADPEDEGYTWTLWPCEVVPGPRDGGVPRVAWKPMCEVCGELHPTVEAAEECAERDYDWQADRLAGVVE